MAMDAEAEEQFAGALAGAEASPEDEASWDLLEELTEALQRPEEVGALYRKVLAQDLSRDVAEALGQRAVQFHEQWFSEDSPHLAEVLTRVLTLDPTSEWALQRSTVLLTVGERWSELLGIYDRALGATRDKVRREQLLDEAASLAKDFAGAPDRAIDYLQQLLQLRPGDGQLFSSLERLLERQGRWAELIGLWRKRMEGVSAREALGLRGRIASCYLDHLGDAGACLAEVRELLDDGVDPAANLALLERIVAFEPAAPDVRRGALDILRERYEAAGRTDDVIRVVGVALGFAQGDERIARHRELGQRLAAKGDATEAMAQWAALLVLDPNADDAQEQLAHLAARADAHETYAQALVAAADAATPGPRQYALLVEAGDVRGSTLGDRAGAIELYQRVLSADARAQTKLTVARRLEKLLDEAERYGDRLAVLAQLTRLESDPVERRRVLGQCARLADKLGDAARALGHWGERLEADASDLEALDAMIELSGREARWELYVDALRRRASADVPAVQRRLDLARIAHTQAAELERIDAAIETWETITEQFGEDQETVDALFDLFVRAGRFESLYEVLGRATQRDAARAAEVLARVGDVCRLHLGRLDEAAKAYHRAAQMVPDLERALEGLKALVEEPEARGSAVRGLAKAYELTDAWEATLALLEPRIELALDDAERVDLLREAAGLAEGRAGDPRAALEHVRRALAHAPAHPELEAELLRLARVNGAHDEAADALARAADALVDARKERAAELRRREALIREQELSDGAGALASWLEAQALAPHDLASAGEAIRVGAQAGLWEGAAKALVAVSTARSALQGELVRELERLADERESLAPLATALAGVLPAPGAIEAALGLAFERTVAAWRRDRLGDAEGAEAALRRALAHEGAHTETLRDLAILQWRTPGRALVETLLKLADNFPDDLDPLHDAARIALDTLGDAALASGILERLLRSARHLWEGEGAVTGERAADATAIWASDELVRLALEAGRHARAVDLLVEASRMPVPPERSRQLRRRAGELAGEKLGDHDRGLRLLQSVVVESVDDAPAVDRFGALLEERGRYAEFLALRQRQLELELESDTRLAVRLEVARVLGLVEAQGGRIGVLRQNLGEHPGHEASVERLAEILSASGRTQELAELYTSQAVEVERQQDGPRAANLWSRAAVLLEGELADVEGALKAHRRVVALQQDAASLDALARLHMQRGEPALAAEWLKRRLDAAAEEEHVGVGLRLADAHLAASHAEAAMGVLERMLQRDPGEREARSRLAALYRDAGAHDPLARLLAEGAAHEVDPATRLAYVREAASLYAQRLGQPERAIPVLQLGVELAPEDQELKGTLALGLRVAGRLSEARAILEELAASFGRRRSPERAAVHFQLAQVAHAAGDLEGARRELDQARKMDLSHPGILRMAGRMAREAGQLEQAEKSYRALLLVVRRQDPGAPDVQVGASEVLYELSLLATAQGDAAQASELLESALSTAAQHDAELERFQKELLAGGAVELALRAVEMRLAAVETPESEARMLASKSAILADHLDRREEALDALIHAITLAPQESALHDACRALAVRMSAVPRYVETVSTLVEKSRRREEAPFAADLLLRLGAVSEHDLGDLEAAAALYERVEKLGVRVVDAWRALARVADLRGDAAGEVRVLRKLVDSDDASVASEARTEALYRVAEVELAAGPLDAGMTTLRSALEREPRYGRAAAILQAAAQESPEDDALLALLEEVARASGDPAMILDYIERRVARPGASLEHVREGVERADAIEAPARAEALLAKGLELAAGEGGLRDALWVPIGLSERREAAGDVPGAIAHLRRAAEAAEGDEAFGLWRVLADLATEEGGDLRLAAEVYRSLLSSDPSNRELWEPLTRVYARLEDREGLEEVVHGTLDALLDPSDRNELRMKHAEFLLEVARSQPDAVAVLQQVLEEDPDHQVAAQRLADLFEASGDGPQLVELLQRQLDRARDRQDVEGIVGLTLRMGKLSEAYDPQAAMDHYRAGLDWAPQSPELLAALLSLHGDEHEPRERAELAERLLEVSSGSEAAELAKQVVALYEGLGDEYATARVLDLGFRACPSDSSLRDRLEAHHRQREEWTELAGMIQFDAARRESPAQAVARFREAARVWRESLGNHARAAEATRAAWQLAPEEVGLLDELVADLAEAGLHSEATGDVAVALERHAEATPARAHLLRARARLELALGNTSPAVSDLEHAYAIDRAGTADELVQGLDALRRAAAEHGDAEAERATTHRLAAVLREAGDAPRSRDVLAEWVERTPYDREALRTLREVDAADERWAEVAGHCARLIEVEAGEEQVLAALGLADACRRIEQLEYARAGVERVLEAQPIEVRVRDALRRLYEDLGAHRELAYLLREDAGATDDEETRFGLLRRAGELLVAVGDAEGALEALAQAVALRPEDHAVIVVLADAYMGSGRLQEAIELLQESIGSFKKRRSPELASMQHRMARIAGVSGDHETQKEWLNVALEADKNNGEIASELAELAIALQDDETALKALRVVTLLKTPGPMSKAVAFLRQAQIAHRQGDPQKAVLWARRARLEDDSLEEAQAFLQEIGEA